MSFLDKWNQSALASLGLFWTALWAFALGYFISSLIQVFVTRKRMQQLMGQDGWKAMTLGTLFGFISSSCSFAALSGARALFAKGAGLAPSLAFLLASTNLVIELGIVIAVFLSWQFVVAEYVGGIMLIVLMWTVARLTGKFVPIEQAREIAQAEDGAGCCAHENHHGNNADGENKNEGDSAERVENTSTHASDEEEGEHNGDDTPSDARGDDRNEDHTEQADGNKEKDKEKQAPSPFLQKDKWAQVAMKYVMEWSMVWKDVTIGFTVAGVIAKFVPRDFFEWLFIGGPDPNFWQLLEHCIVGPVAAFFTFIGSMGNIPLAAVLYGNGVSFAGIIAFIFSDLVVIPVLRVNAKYYGWKMALYISSIFLFCIIVTALILHYVFEALDILPSTENVTEVTERDYFKLDYTFGLNIGFLAGSIVLFGWHFYMNGVQLSMGSNTTEVVLFWLALGSYLWIIGGLLAGAAA